MKQEFKIANKFGNGKTRTGQTSMMGPNYPAGMPPCGPAPAGTPMSWGSACPPGYCSADQLARNLNRAFAGDRYGCRELSYWLTAVASAGGVATFDDNAIITICPTRVIVLSAVADGDLDAELTEFTIGAQNQIYGDPMPIRMLHPQSYQIIPFVTDCIKAGQPFSLTVTGATAASTIYFGLIGPAVG